MPHLLKRLLLIFMGLALLSGLAFSLRPQPTPVEVEIALVGPLVVILEEEGRTRIRNRFLVHAPLRGRLHRIDYEVGDSIEAGQTLGRLDPLAQESAIASAQASIAEWRAQIEGIDAMRPKKEALEQARFQVQIAKERAEVARTDYQRAGSALEQARTNRERLEKLALQRAAAESDLDEARTTEVIRTHDVEAARQRIQVADLLVSVAQAATSTLESERSDPDYLLEVYGSRIEAVEARLRLLADERSRTEITSPIAGRILRLFEKSERFVEAGTPLLEIGDPTNLEVTIDVLTTDAVRISAGTSAELFYGGEQSLAARVRSVEPGAFTRVSALGVEEQRVNVIADLEQPTHNLGDGYRIDARILIWQGETVLQAPLASIFRDRGEWALFVVSDGYLEQRRIKIGHRGERFVEILEGIVAGETLVIYPTADLESGLEVRARR